MRTLACERFRIDQQCWSSAGGWGIQGRSQYACVNDIFQPGQKRACFCSIRPKEGLFLSTLSPEENELSGTRAIGRDVYLQPGRRVPGKEGVPRGVPVMLQQ